MTVLDVRPEDEFASGHIPAAVNIPLAQLRKRLAELPSDREIVAYCRGPWCVLAFEAVALLRKQGRKARRLRRRASGMAVSSIGLPVELEGLRPADWPDRSNRCGPADRTCRRRGIGLLERRRTAGASTASSLYPLKRMLAIMRSANESKLA